MILIPIAKLPDKLQEIDGAIEGNGWDQDIFTITGR